MKKKIFTYIVIAGIAVGAYIFFTAFNTKKLDEASPLKTSQMMKDTFDTMGREKRIEFDAAVEESKPIVMKKNEIMPAENPRIVSEGGFTARAHEVAGKAILIEHDGKKTLRFENFETINGPNLHIYLSSNLGGDDYVDLGKIKATQGNVNYEVPANVDTGRYNKVLVWCVPFSVLFSYADLK